MHAHKDNTCIMFAILVFKFCQKQSAAEADDNKYRLENGNFHLGSSNRTVSNFLGALCRAAAINHLVVKLTAFW